MVQFRAPLPRFGMIAPNTGNAGHYEYLANTVLYTKERAQVNLDRDNISKVTIEVCTESILQNILK